MKVQDFKKLNTEELHKLLLEKRDSLRDFAYGTTGSKAKNVKSGNVLKKDIARILTQINALRISK